jgi:hypothetical protein
LYAFQRAKLFQLLVNRLMSRVLRLHIVNADLIEATSCVSAKDESHGEAKNACKRSNARRLQAKSPRHVCASTVNSWQPQAHDGVLTFNALQRGALASLLGLPEHLLIALPLCEGERS